MAEKQDARKSRNRQEEGREEEKDHLTRKCLILEWRAIRSCKGRRGVWANPTSVQIPGQDVA